MKNHLRASSEFAEERLPGRDDRLLMPLSDLLLQLDVSLGKGLWLISVDAAHLVYESARRARDGGKRWVGGCVLKSD